MWICAIGYSDSSCQLTSTLGAPNDIGGAVYNLLVSVSAEGGLVSLHARVASALPGLPGSFLCDNYTELCKIISANLNLPPSYPAW